MQPVLSVEKWKQPGSDGSSNGRWLDFSLYFDDANMAKRAVPDLGGWPLEAVAFADQHGFCAVWPAQSAPIAATKRVAIRRATEVFPSLPLKAQSPLWIAAGKNSDAFKTAGRIGAYVQTRLLGRSIESLAQDIALYRRTWAQACHAGEGYVTVAVPTLVGEDTAVIEPMARAAMRVRLHADLPLLGEAAWDFADFAKASEEDGSSLEGFLKACSVEQRDALIDFATERYIAGNALFGDQTRCMALLERLKQIGIDEIGCQIDFGWPATVALEHLPALDALRVASNAGEAVRQDRRDDRTPKCTLPITQPQLEIDRTETYKKMTALWEQLLDVPEVAAGDNFLDLGGHSLLAARAVSEIERTFGVRMSIKTLMISSLSQVAAEIDRHLGARETVAGTDNAQPDVSRKSENPNVGRLASWFKNRRNGDRFQDA